MLLLLSLLTFSLDSLTRVLALLRARPCTCQVLLLAFCGFEALLGVYWPAIALLRSSELSDAQVRYARTHIRTGVCLRHTHIYSARPAACVNDR